MKVNSIIRYSTNIINVILWTLLIAATIILLVILFTNPHIWTIIILVFIIILIYIVILANKHKLDLNLMFTHLYYLY